MEITPKPDLQIEILEELNKNFSQEIYIDYLTFKKTDDSDSVSLKKIDEIIDYMCQKYSDKYEEFNYKKIENFELDIKLIVCNNFVNSILKAYFTNDNVSSIYFCTGITFLPLSMHVNYYKGKTGHYEEKYIFSYSHLLNAVNNFVKKCAIEAEPTINKKNNDIKVKVELIQDRRNNFPLPMVRIGILKV